MAKVFKSKNGKTTDIMHSHDYHKSTFQNRRKMAFDKKYLSNLSDRDKYLMRGYAQAKVEELQAFRYRNPVYKRKAR